MIGALNLLGGLAVFLFGMRTMSRGLERLAGDRLRAILAALTTNRFTGIFGGFVITSIIQSSSATTVLVVSFANAGLLSMLQATGLVMGANIGTTVTGWLVSIFGFKVKITAFALPIIGIGFPLSFLSSERMRRLSEVMVGFGLLFLGLSILKDAVPTIDASNPDDLATIDFIRRFTSYGFGSTLLFVLIGTVLTVVVQSSSATMAITLVLADQGWIDFELAAAMVLGENIGTTITANLAAIGASRNAIRVARFHTLFNMIGVLWMLAAMPFILDAIPSITGGNPVENPHDRATALALFHTIFNITNTFALVWFSNKLAALVLRLVPRTEDEREGPHLEYLKTSLLETPELATIEGKRALEQMGQVCIRMFERSKQSLLNPEPLKFGSLREIQKNDEKTTDEMEEEIVRFGSQLAARNPSDEVANEVTLLLEIVDELENTADHCNDLVKMASQKRRLGSEFPGEASDELRHLVELVDELLGKTMALISEDDSVQRQALHDRAHELIDEIRDHYLESTEKHPVRISDAADRSKQEPDHEPGSRAVRSSLLFLEMLSGLRYIAEMMWSVQKAVARRHPDLTDED